MFFYLSGLIMNKQETRKTTMSWNPNQGQDPNQPSQDGGGYTPPVPPPQPTDPYSGQQGGYGQPGGYQQPGQQPGGYQQGGYQQPYGAPASSGAAASGPTSMGLQPNIAAGLSYVL